jgi:hypothetical protein
VPARLCVSSSASLHPAAFLQISKSLPLAWLEGPALDGRNSLRVDSSPNRSRPVPFLGLFPFANTGLGTRVRGWS